MRRAQPTEIGAEATERVFADEGEAGEPAQFLAADGAVQRARRRFHIGVGMQNDPRSGGQRDKHRGRQVIFDNGEIDAATPQQPSDAPGLSEIAADRRVGDRRDFDAFERLVHRRADDQGRAPISAVKRQIANAEFDRSGEPRPEMGVSQQDVGDFRLARHDHIRSSRRAPRLLAKRPYTEQSGRTIDPNAIAGGGEFCLKGRPDNSSIDRTLVQSFSGAPPNRWSHLQTSRSR